MPPLLNCSELSAIGKRKWQFRLWISKPVTWMWYQTRKGRNLSFFGWSVHVYVPAFFVAQTPVTTEWPAEWDMILPRPLVWTERARQRCGETLGQELHLGRTAKETKMTVTTKSHTVTSRETVLTVSTQIDSVCRLLFRDTLIPE